MATPATRTGDPTRDLNNYLQGVKKGENLTPQLGFTSTQAGKNSEAVHTWTFTFRGVTIGEGKGTTKSAARGCAAEKALDFFDANGIPE